MISLSPYTIAANTEQAIQIDNTVDRIIIANESNLSLQVVVSGYAKWIPAWTVDMLDLSRVPSRGVCTLMPYAILSSTATPPSSSVLVTLLNKGDSLPGTYPYSLARQVTASAVSQSALNLLAPDEKQEVYLDDTDVPGTLIVIPSQTPTPTGVLELALARRVDASNASVFMQSDSSTSVPTARAKLPFCFDIDAGVYIKGFQIIHGIGPVTGQAHNLGIIPTAVITCCTNGGVANVAVSNGNWTSTNFNVYCPAGTDWYAILFA